MKKTYLFFLLTLLTFEVDFARAVNFPTVKEQLEDLNKLWVGKNFTDPVLKQRIPLTNDVSLIQMHLSLVEKTLRSKNCDDLTNDQKQNREKSLDILHDYWIRGIFPKNLYHSKRTPYFIDEFGTACAVGQLIISTGYAEFANKIRKENNNGYITELNSKYPEIKEWAMKYGFTIDELAWIQPCYCSVSGTGIVNVSCYGGNDGYFAPSPTGGVAPYSFNGWYRWNGSSWDMLFCGGCDLAAGYYKCTVTDAVGTVQDYYATITQPSMISQSISHTNDNGSCNGTANVIASGGTPGYTYSWMPGGYTSDIITDLCANTYSLTITDNNGCVSTGTVNVTLATEITDLNSSSGILLYPNPANNNTTLTFDNSNRDMCSLSIYDAQGRLVHTITDINTDKLEIKTYDLTSGLYFLQLHSDKKIIASGKLKIE